jgi:hypothetical protein
VILPPSIAHADWGTDPKKRQVAVAELHSDGHYRIVTLSAAQSITQMAGDLRLGFHLPRGRGQLLVGFDLPFGLPRAYAALAGISFFPEFLPDIGHGPWARFAECAALPAEVSIHRPFYPARSGGTKRAHLYDGLGLTREQIRRRADGSDAETMFWTLGGKQVGKAALCGWAYLSAVTAQKLAFWPFHGSLATLLHGDPTGVVVAEAYPREFYQYFRSGVGGRGSKRNHEDRLRWMEGLLEWAEVSGVLWSADVLSRVKGGFSEGRNGEDEFDAVVGLIGMIAVVTGKIPSGEPETDTAIRTVEGWILGRSATTSILSAPNRG